MSQSEQELPYRPNVAMLLFRKSTGLLWIGERAGQPGHWQFPQGGVDDDTSLEQNVIRELNEELGVPAHALGTLTKLNWTNTYDFSNSRAYGGEQFRGQTQTFWAVPFLGEDSLIKLDAHEREFDSWRWVTEEEALRIAAPQRLKGYQGAIAEFSALRKAGAL